MYFENRSGEPDLERILVEMLTTNLSRYDTLEVVSSQRLRDIFKVPGKQDIEFIDSSVATDVAKHADVVGYKPSINGDKAANLAGLRKTEALIC
jgi:hypothetical protein